MVKLEEISALEALRASELPLALSRFAGSFAHELGTPLNVIAGHAAMIASGELVGPTAIASAKKIAEQATRMTEMIRRVIRQTELPPLQKAKLLLTDLVTDAVEVMQPAMARNHVNAHVVVPEHVAESAVQADRGRLLTAFLAVFENAAQSMPKGGTVTVTLSHRELEPPHDTTLPKGRFVCVAIADTGVGIAPDRMGDIFRAFYTSKDVGTGLGLPLAQSAIRAHGGFIIAESTQGQGSTFTMCLPISNDSTLGDRHG